MIASSYDASMREAWDRFVLTNPDAGIGHLTATFDLAGTKTALRNRSFLVTGADGDLAAVMPLFTTRHRELRWAHIRTLRSGDEFPAGPLLSPQLSASKRKDTLELVMETVDTIAEEARADEIVVGFPPILGSTPAVERFGYYPLRRFGYRECNVVALKLDLRLEERALFEQLHPRCRNMIRRSTRAGVEFRPIADRATWLECYDLYVQTLGPLAYPKQAFSVIWEQFIQPRHAFAGAVAVGNHICCVSVATTFAGTSYYWLGFSRKPTPIPGATNYALWRTICHCRESGSVSFELGSLEFEDAKQQGISAFKESFGGRPFYVLSGRRVLSPGKRLLLDGAGLLIRSIRTRKPVSASSEQE